MTNNQLNRERLEKIKSWRETYGAGSNVMLPAEEAEELARIALAALDSEPVAYAWVSRSGKKHLTRCEPEQWRDAVIVTPLYSHAQPAPVVPDEMSFEAAISFVEEVGALNERDAAYHAWNACRAAMPQELQKSAGVSNNCRSNEKVQAVNDVTAGKPLTITLPDISSKAFWSSNSKTEVFHPETYKRWTKEAIERYCAIARIEVEVR